VPGPGLVQAERDAGSGWPPSRARRLAVPALQVALATATALLLLGRKSFWLDESYSFVAAHRELTDLLRLVVHDESNMSPYYLALHFWISVGRSEAWLRLLSVLPAIAAVPLFALLVRSLAGRRAAVLAGFGLALNPMHVRYAQEARGYSLLVLCVVASTLIFVRAVLRPRPQLLIAWAVLCAAAAYVHYFAILVTCAQLASLALLPDRGVVARRFVPATGLVLLLDLPIALFIARRPGDPLSWVAPLSLRDPPALAAQFAGSIPLAVASLPLLAIAGHLAVRRLRERGRSPATWQHGLLWLWLALPPLVTLVASLAHPLWVPRYLIVSLPAFVALCAIGLARLRGRFRAGVIGLLAGLTLVALAGGYAPDTTNGENWRAASGQVLSRLQARDAVWFVGGDGRAPFAYYAWSAGLPPVADLTLAPAGAGGRIHARELSRALVRAKLAGQERVWLVIRHRRDPAADAGNAWTLTALTQAGFREDEAVSFGSAVEVQSWSRKAPTR
jgi:mannosyltransferase